MRAVLLLVALAACTPDVVPGSYLCGPEQLCPEGQACNGTEDEDTGLIADSCVLPSVARPFACTPEDNTEPDDTADQAHLIPNIMCVSTVQLSSCMMASDTADWLSFVAPSVCTAVEVEVRITFPVAYEQLGVELWDLDHNMQIATDTECPVSSEEGSERRCLDIELVPGTKYAVKVKPTGEGDCGGACAYNRYSLSVQLATPG